VLARANRIVAGADYRLITRKGRRSSGRFTVISVIDPSPAGVPRFGFIITRRVGGAVERNRIRRRLKAIGFGLVREGLPARDIVVRALPASISADWDSLRDEVSAAAMRSSR
jgi:ribonuclease P protein component